MTSSKNLRVAIVEDEPIARQRLYRLISANRDVDVVAEASTGQQAIEMLLTKNVDVVFLDVELPEIDGFGVIEALGNRPLPAIIFVTAYDEFAVKAFERNAVDYLLKPFNSQRLQAALAKARSKRTSDNGSPPPSLPEARRDRLVIKCGRKYLMLRQSDIHSIEAAGNYMVVCSGKQSYTVREPMSSFEQRLDPNQFLRIHRSFMINVNRILEVKPSSYGQHLVTLQNGKQITITRTYRETLAKIIRP